MFLQTLQFLSFIIVLSLPFTETKTIRAIIEGPGINKLGDYPGILDFYNKDINYFENVEYTAHRPPTSKADITFVDAEGNTVKSFYIADFSNGEICSLLESNGFTRLKMKKKSDEEKLMEALNNGEPVLFDGLLYNDINEFDMRKKYQKQKEL